MRASLLWDVARRWLGVGINQRLATTNRLCVNIPEKRRLQGLMYDMPWGHLLNTWSVTCRNLVASMFCMWACAWALINGFSYGKQAGWKVWRRVSRRLENHDRRSGGFERVRNIIQLVISLKEDSMYFEDTKIPKYQKEDASQMWKERIMWVKNKV